MNKKPLVSGCIGFAVLIMIQGCSGGRPPLNLGINEGQLAPCPAAPNCVSSEATAADQRVELLRYADDAPQARARLRNVLNGMARVRIVQSTDDYLHVEFRSALWGFVDDVEFYFNPPGTIQLRSASRTGYDDFGVNRERLETIRSQFSITPVTP